ncbi:MAG: hypothetical protein J5875_05955 [Paludibacteraceae bacterium]|nr:hypothetical protein [Paludibacteraceae bacterium]
MTIEECIVVVLAQANRGLTTEQIADTINRKRMHIRTDGKPVSGRQVYAVVCRNPAMFIKEGGRIMLMI